MLDATPNRLNKERARRRRLFTAILAAALCAGAIALAVGAFFLGRQASQEKFVRSTRALVANETSLISLYDAYQAYGKEEIDNPNTIEALGKIYGLPNRSRDAVLAHLRTIAWVPPYRMAPFVGHIARPMLGREPHINFLGFRDERDTYVTKPDRTVRIFITGGSTAWGSGATSQKNTISYLLEGMLNERASPATGYRYEVVNTAYPAWSTTQEKLLIQQRLVDMGPDAIVMFSGVNDVHWSLYGRDIRWFSSVPEQNYNTMLNELYASKGHPEWGSPFPRATHTIGCSETAKITQRNVEASAYSAGQAGARLTFVLIPNILSTSKRLTEHERRVLSGQKKPHWDECFEALRTELGGMTAANYRFLDLSRSFGELDERMELFIDAYHFADFGNRVMAEALFAHIDWRSLTPHPMPPLSREQLKIVDIEPREWRASIEEMRIQANRVNENLRIVLGETILTTRRVDDTLVATVTADVRASAGPHVLYVVDHVTGERSEAVTLPAR
jgi:hypothetical protein